ncbi:MULTISPECIES: isochorismatase family protein [Bosea]|jgi:nicotinamidase-related amidase|uniref:Nicotinamidase-related amidase n=1 Tax=Bosea robiniae TaxID=1036780 RepID=A0ABY0P1N0_9HYPH|nr:MULTISPECIES: isochorismatase family protein [Bosea]TQI73768.1 nicotinamidase-related amidase [Bosea sp. AK1]SDG22213.1 Nicotinamidase-related amidase [Bosea robiniae]
MTDTLFDAKTTALVSIDMQTSVAHHAAAPHSATEVVARIASMIEPARAAGALPVFVRTTFLPDESDNLGPNLDVKRPRYPHRIENWDQLVPEMDRRINEPVVNKKSFNAFYGSDLDLQLRRRGIKTIVLAGISTNFGVEGTGRNAYDHGYDVIFVRDAMAAGTAEAHEASLKYVFPYIGRVRSTDEIIAAFKAQA